MHFTQLLVLTLLALSVHCQNDVCQRAINATILAARIAGQSNNMTAVLAAQTMGAVAPVNAELATAYTAVQRNITLYQAQQLSDLANFFTAPPYAGWGSRSLQTAMGQALYVPAATLGEIAYISNKLTRSTNASTPFEQAAKLWNSTISDVTDRLMDAAMNNTDPYSKRSLLLRYTVYEFMRNWALPPSDELVAAHNAAVDAFEEAATMFAAYQFKTFSYNFNNGTTNTTLNGFLAAASSEKSPLMIIFGSLYNWKEITFLRYGLGALRRNFAVAVIELPGQNVVTSRPLYTPSYDNFSTIGNAIIDVIESDEDWKILVDTNEVYLMGIATSAYSAALACMGMGTRVKGCIFNPGLYRVKDLGISVVAKGAFAPFQLMGRSLANLFPNADTAKLFADASNSIVAPLLLNCTADSGAPAALAALYNAMPYDPEFGQAIVSLVGKPNPSTYQNINNQVWYAFSRLATQYSDYNPGDLKVPVAVFGGEQDMAIGGQEKDLFDRLSPIVKRQSILYVFPSKSGAALGAQIGAGAVLEQQLYPWLAGISRR